ncbi:MAG: TonB-dependent receptor [Cyclobacteriaceae bacterium]
MRHLYLILGIFGCFSAYSQEDSVKTFRLEEITIQGQQELRTIGHLPDIQKTYLWGGKKSEVIKVQNLDANIAEKTARQIFAKVPGVFVYDMDGGGNQMNISTRGLDPHRGWEFNIRRNGAITNSDMYGYPASHYSMPMEAVEKIELVRGTGSLQYGAQFGGMLNYVSKQPDTTKAISLESINSIGSFGLLSTYNAVSGTVGKFQYYAYYSKRKSDGYRDNSKSDYDAQSFMLVYNASDNLKLTGEISRSNYVYQIPGPLTDSMFYANPRQSTRSRNYFNPEIYIPSLKIEWSIAPRTNMQWTTSAVLGNRNSVQFDRPANIKDGIDSITLSYSQRQVDIDHFNSYTSELRLLHRYNFLNGVSTIVGGIQLMRNNLNRQQLGKGTTGSDFDLSLSQPGWGRDLHFQTNNIAVFAENNFKLSQSLSINPGFRMEVGKSDMYGTITYYDASKIPNSISHKFPLFGVTGQYRLKLKTTIYVGWSQAYRPVIFKDIIPASVYESVNKDFKDASGYNLEAGFRGNSKSFNWDVTLYQLQYNNRLGSQATRDESGSFILYRTNIGNSKTKGAEIFAEYSFQLGKHLGLSLFTSTAFMKSRYEGAQIRSGENNININGNKVESVPDVITRNGLTIKSYFASISFLYSYTGETYADPLNTKVPTSTGAVGIVPSYGLLDINSSFKIAHNVKLRLNINNVSNKQYFTKRPSFYPGPGIWTSDGRSINLSLGLKF